jgi:hypothetical protein
LNWLIAKSLPNLAFQFFFFSPKMKLRKPKQQQQSKQITSTIDCDGFCVQPCERATPKCERSQQKKSQLNCGLHMKIAVRAHDAH